MKRYSSLSGGRPVAVLFLLAVLGSCGSVPGRTIQPQGTWNYEVSLSVGFVDGVAALDPLPLPLNLAFGARYGVARDVDVGGRVYPVPLLAGIAAVAPWVSWKLLGEGEGRQLNGSVLVPIVHRWASATVDVSPRLDAVVVQQGAAVDFYSGLGIETSIEEIAGGGPWVHLNLSLGAMDSSPAPLAWEAELALLHVGEYSQVSPLSRWGVGVPAVAIGLDWRTGE